MGESSPSAGPSKLFASLPLTSLVTWALGALAGAQAGLGGMATIAVISLPVFGGAVVIGKLVSQSKAKSASRGCDGGAVGIHAANVIGAGGAIWTRVVLSQAHGPGSELVPVAMPLIWGAAGIACTLLGVVAGFAMDAFRRPKAA